MAKLSCKHQDDNLCSKQSESYNTGIERNNYLPALNLVCCILGGRLARNYLRFPVVAGVRDVWGRVMGIQFLPNSQNTKILIIIG